MDFILRSVVNDASITIRRFLIPNDAHLVYQWTAHSLGGWLWIRQPPIEEIIQVFKSIEASDIATAYIVEADEVPLFEIDIRLAETDPASAYYAARSDDQSINLLFPPNPNPQLTLIGLTECIDYFFSAMAGNVNRIIAPIYNHDQFLHTLLEQAGFEPVTLVKEGKIDEIYGLSKQAFMKRKQSRQTG